METFSALLAICAGNSPVPGEFPSQRPVTRSFDVFFDLRLNKRLSNGKAGGLRRNRLHYGVIVMGGVSIEQWANQNNLYSLDFHRLIYSSLPSHECKHVT